MAIAGGEFRYTPYSELHDMIPRLTCQIIRLLGAGPLLAFIPYPASLLRSLGLETFLRLFQGILANSDRQQHLPSNPTITTAPHSNPDLLPKRPLDPRKPGH